MSSLVNQANCFDADVAHAKWAFFRLRKIVAVAKQELGTQRRWRQRATRICNLLPLTLVSLVVLACQALFSGAVWFLHYSSRPVLIRSSWLAEKGRILLARVVGYGAMGPAIAMASVTLVTVVVVYTAKPSPSVELVMPVLPDTQGSTKFTTTARREALREPSEGAAPGFARVSLLSEAVPEALPPFGKDIASIMLLMTPLPAPEGTSVSEDVSTDVTEPLQLSHTRTSGTISRKTAAVAAPADDGKARPAEIKLVTEQTEATIEPLQPQQTELQRRDFVPHAFW